MPNHKLLQKETLRNLRRELKNYQGLKDSELIVMGDWNFVEDKIDRSPQHDDDRGVMREMVKLKTSLDLIDGWRAANPDKRSFSWEGTSGNERKKIFSRLDRIYTSRKTWEITNEYKIINSDVSDHDGVSTTIREATTPDTGKGEPKLNMNIINHPLFKNEADRLLTKLEIQIKKYNRREASKNTPGKLHKLLKLRARDNPQKSWNEYKAGILRASEGATKARRKDLTKIRIKAEKDIQRAEKQLKESTPEKEEENRKNLSDKKKTLSDHEEETRNIRTHLKEAKWFLTNEKSSKQWFGMFKSRNMNTGIKSLFKSGSNEETEAPLEMLKIARTHHSELQREPEMNDSQRDAIKTILSDVKRHLNDKEIREINKDVSFKEVNETIRKSPSGKAPGPDGIPNEFWKQEIKWREKEKEKNKTQLEKGTLGTRPCIIAMMTRMLQDVESFGPMDTRFMEARMGLLYKKKDRRDVQNYRLITLLNTDYKIYTKTIANRLREVAPKLIHKDQAGFMPKRSIHDQTKMVELMIKWCENTETKGMIICLDQEKAYDRIDLTYLWKTLEAYGFPDLFISKIKNLYASASTAIRINSYISELFNVRRGVRQGDPMSCLLYNLAIEPLIERIRSSTLKGFNVSDDLIRVLVKVYADDTTAYIGPEDDPNTLQECLDLFCKASTAKFNNQKTKIIPLGSEEERNRLIRTREYNGWKVDNGIHIAQDGKATRILGSWQGHGINIQAKWNEMLDRKSVV